jgi:hypothetical protein
MPTKPGGNNTKQSPIPVVPRMMRIVNPDGTLTRSGQLLLEQIQDQVVSDITGEPTPPDVTGPVTGFTVAHEVGTRYADDPDRLVHLTVGFVPIMPTPQTVTYLISADDGATWVWIGSQHMVRADQELHVDRLAPGEDSLWRVAAIAGNQGGDPVPILDADLETLYPGVVRSFNFPVAGLATPPAAGGITATIGVCSNVVTADGLTQYGVIPGVVYTDPVGGTDFFVRITVQDLDTAGAPLSDEKPHGGTMITGGTHTEKDLLVTYLPNLGFIRYRFYTANRNSQGAGDFADPTTNTLQMVRYNGAAPADHYDVPITIPTFTPVDPNDVFNVLSVTASEVGPKYQDEKAGLHTVVGVVPVIDVPYDHPHTVTIWFDFGNGKPVWQGSYSNNFAAEVIRIGDQTLGSDGTRKSGDIWVPANASQGTWKVWCAPGNLPKNISPTSYPNSTFTVIPVGPCSPTGITNCRFIANPDTSDPITYYKDGLGHWFWEYFRLEWIPPTQAAEPDFWFSMITVQKGATISGVWTPAPDPEGRNADPYLNYLGRVHDQIMTVPGLAPDQTVIMQRTGAYPSTWIIPPSQNVDLTPYLYREFRFLMYSVSRLGTDSSGSGGAGTYTLQTSCWPGGQSFFILTPVPKVGDLDLRYANPNTISGPLSGGAGNVITIRPSDITGTYLADDAILARHMSANSITAADGALAANAVVDGNINDVNVSKLIAGTKIFTGDVILSRGSAKPVILLQNAGIYLFGVSTGPGNAGLTTSPNVAIESGGISLFSGGLPSTTITSSAITFWSQNGVITKPYATMSSNGFVVTDGGTTPGPNTFSLNTSGMTVQDKNGAQVTVNAGVITMLMARSVAGNGNTTSMLDGSGLKFSTGVAGQASYTELKMDATGIALTKGVTATAPSVAMTANAITLQTGSTGPMVNITSSSLELTNGATGPSVKLSTTQVVIDKGAFSAINADYVVNIDNGNALKVTSQVNGGFFQVIGLSSGAGGGVVAFVQNSAGTAGVSQRFRTVTGGVFGELTITGSGTATGYGTGGTVKIRGGTGGGGSPPPANVTGYIAAEVNGNPVSIPYY